MFLNKESGTYTEPQNRMEYSAILFSRPLDKNDCRTTGFNGQRSAAAEPGCSELEGCIMRKIVSSGPPFEPQIGFSRAVRVGPFVAVSGTAPIAPWAVSRLPETFTVKPDAALRSSLRRWPMPACP